MTYSTFMVQLQFGSPHSGLLRIVGDLAERFNAGVIGVVACRPIDVSYGDTYGHSRLRKWAFGGVTRDLLSGAEHCSLVSH